MAQQHRSIGLMHAGIIECCGEILAQTVEGSLRPIDADSAPISRETLREVEARICPARRVSSLAKVNDRSL